MNKCNRTILGRVAFCPMNNINSKQDGAPSHNVQVLTTYPNITIFGLEDMFLFTVQQIALILHLWMYFLWKYLKNKVYYDKSDIVFKRAKITKIVKNHISKYNKSGIGGRITNNIQQQGCHVECVGPNILSFYARSFFSSTGL